MSFPLLHASWLFPQLHREHYDVLEPLHAPPSGGVRSLLNPPSKLVVLGRSLLTREFISEWSERSDSAPIQDAKGQHHKLGMFTHQALHAAASG